MEGAEAAAEEWREQQQELLKQVQQLEAQLVGLRGSRGGHKGGDASDASSSLKSELESLKSEMRADLHSSLKTLEERWQERPGLPVAVPRLHAAHVLHPCILASKPEWLLCPRVTVGLLQSLGSPNKADEAAINKLRLQIMQLEDMVTHLSETQSSFAPNGTTGIHSSWLPPSCSALGRLSRPHPNRWNAA